MNDVAASRFLTAVRRGIDPLGGKLWIGGSGDRITFTVEAPVGEVDKAQAIVSDAIDTHSPTLLHDWR